MGICMAWFRAIHAHATALLLLSLLLSSCTGSLTKVTQIVYVPASQHVEGVEVKYPGSQAFKISQSPFDSTVRITPNRNGNSEYVISVIARCDEGGRLNPDAITVCLQDDEGSPITVSARPCGH